MSEPIYEVEIDKVYRSVNGYPMIVDSFSRHAMDCSIRMVNYTNIEPTFDYPAGERWSLEESMFLKRFTEDESLALIGPRRRAMLRKRGGSLGLSPEMSLNIRVRNSDLVIVDGVPIKITANGKYYDISDGGERLTNLGLAEVNKKGVRPPRVDGRIADYVFNEHYPPLNTWVILKVRYGVYTLGIRLQKYAIKDDTPQYYTLDGVVKEALPWAYV